MIIYAYYINTNRQHVFKSKQLKVVYIQCVDYHDTIIEFTFPVMISCNRVKNYNE